MNQVTYETARLLKEAGFPQPEFASGQLWYNECKALSIIGRREISDDGSHEFFHCMSMESGRIDRIIPLHEGAFFAPTATEILVKLPDHTLEYGAYGQFESPSFKVRSCGYATDYGYEAGDEISRSENPSEACALAWIEKNKNKLHRHRAPSH